MDLTALGIPAIMARYQDEEQAWLDLESIVWMNGPVCPHCGTIDHAYFLKAKNGPRVTKAGNVSYRRLWKCAECLKKFSVLKGTIFEDSKIPVSKWMLAIKLYTSAKNGISAHEMHRQLGIAYESAWFMEHRLRHGVAPTTPKRKLADTVEADETYIGGKRKGAKPGRPGPDSHKVPVVTLVERNGEARSHTMESVTSKNVREMLQTHVEESATIMTDEFPLYHKATEGFAGHGVVTHKDGEYVRGKVHTNTAEGYFSQLKRSLDGTHHHVSAQHLPRYVAEFDFRYNTRQMKDSERVIETIRRGRGRRLKYQDAKGKKGALGGR